MKKIYKLLPIFAVAFLITGIFFISYPIVGNVCSYFHNTSTIDEYTDNISNLTETEMEDAKKNAEKLNSGNLSEVEVKSCYDALNLGDVISYIDIPKINVYIPIYNGTDEDTLQLGIGHLENSSFPIGGLGTHCVLTGHSGLTTNEMFTNLEELSIGDEFKLHTFDEILTYKVDQIKIASPEDVVNYLSYEYDKDYCSLITCTPVGVNTHRLIVRGSFVSKETVNLKPSDNNISSNDEIKGSSNFSFIEKYWNVIIFLAIVILLILLIILRKVIKKRKS